jgi:hypothetical protein
MYWFKSFSIGQQPILLILLLLGTGMHISFDTHWKSPVVVTTLLHHCDVVLTNKWDLINISSMNMLTDFLSF